MAFVRRWWWVIAGLALLLAVAAFVAINIDKFSYVDESVEVTIVPPAD